MTHDPENENQLVTLFRPVGPEELKLIEEANFTAFPPRLPGQPIFYPVCNEKYADEIAQRWNTKDGNKGYVTRFKVRAEALAQFPVQVVGAKYHQELWVPAADQDLFNQAIVGLIEVIREFSNES